MAAAKLLATESAPFSQTELPLSEQSSILEKPERKVSQVTANESVQEEVLAVKNSLETGQLSKLLIEVSIVVLHGNFCLKTMFQSDSIKYPIVTLGHSLAEARYH